MTFTLYIEIEYNSENNSIILNGLSEVDAAQYIATAKTMGKIVQCKLTPE